MRLIEILKHNSIDYCSHYVFCNAFTFQTSNHTINLMTEEQVFGGEGDSTFTLEQVQLQFQTGGRIKKLLVSNNILYIILQLGLVYRINLDNPENVEKISIGLRTGLVKNAFVDMKGYHLIIQTDADEFYYLNQKSRHAKELSKLRGLRVTCVSFVDSLIKESSTGPVLVSTADGYLYEIKLESKKERLVKQIWHSKHGISYVCNVSIGKHHSDGTIGCKVMCGLTSNRIVQFRCKINGSTGSTSSSFQNSFKREPISFNFNSIIHMTRNSKSIAFLDINEEDSSYQVTYGSINFKSKKELDHVKLDLISGSSVSSIMLTEYYILVLTSLGELVIYNQLNQHKISSARVLPSNEPFIGFVSDIINDTFWLYSCDIIYEVVVDKENSGIWKLMVEKEMFDDAIATLKSPNGVDHTKYDAIVSQKSKFLFEKGDYENSAKCFAETSQPIEHVSLMFMDAHQEKPLRNYLLKKLETIPKTNVMQTTILSSWLVELFMEQLNAVSNELLSSHSVFGSSEKTNANKSSKTETILESLIEEFHSFLKDFKDELDKETVYQIILSHDRKKELLYFANLVGDYNFVLRYYMSLSMWEDALKVLTFQRLPELVYKYSTILFVNYSVKTCDIWIRLLDDLQYLKLLPALLTYQKSVAEPRSIAVDRNQAIRFLRYLIDDRQVKDRIIHNTYLSILLSYPNLNNEDPILKYLENCRGNESILGSSGNSSNILFDPDFILRTAINHHRIKSAVYIYSLIGDYMEAVQLALKHELIELAVLEADRISTFTLQETKMIWLCISKVLIKNVLSDESYLEKHKDLFINQQLESSEETSGNRKKSQIRLVLRYLMRKCDSISMKDLLPLFPDFVFVDNFKEEVVKSLQNLSSELSDLQQQMDDSVLQSDHIKQQIKQFKEENFQIIEPHESCMLCHKILTTRRFVTFPCFHSFHQDCLVKRISESSDYKLKSEIYVLQKKLAQNSRNRGKLTLIRKEIDDVLSRKCCLCTDISINGIDVPFVAPNDKEASNWDI